LVAAVIISVVADCAVDELARCGVTAGIVRAAGHTATVAVFAFLDDTVAALCAADGDDIFVGGKTLRVD